MYDPTKNHSTLRSRYNKLGKRIQVLLARKKILTDEEIELSSKILQAKSRLEYKDEVAQVLDQLQNKSQKKNIELYSDLLTNMVHDIQPKNKEQKIKFDLTSKRGKPNLDIYMDVGNEDFEDIFGGRGGSLTNIVSTGLRYIVLSKTRNRRFMVLDEADSWLSDNYVPAFSKVINDISNTLGFQTLSISHKPSDLFHANVIRLSRDAKTKKVRADLIKEIDDMVNEDDRYQDINKSKFTKNIGIKKIKLKNFMSLENVEIPLCNTMNVIVGEGDLGKSAIFAAINAFVDNKGNSSMITHGKSEFEIEIIIEEDISLKMIHKRKGAKKTRYEMTIPGEKTISEENGQTLPSFIDEVLAIRKINDFNVQLAHQKFPVFMLGPDVTSSSRAELLSLGRESDKIQKMINLHGDMNKKDAKIIKEGFSRLSEIKKDIEILDRIEKISHDYDIISDNIDYVVNNEYKLENYIRRGQEIKRNLEKIYKLTNIKYVKRPEIVSLPDQSSTNSIIKTGVEYNKNLKKIRKLKDISLVKKPDIFSDNIKSIDDKIIYEIESSFKNIQKTAEEVNLIKKEQLTLLENQKDLLNSLGNVCPLCHQNIQHAHN